MIKQEDYIGKKFGRLTIKSFTDPYLDKYNRKHIRVNCNCDCGQTNFIIKLTKLKCERPNGGCGCLKGNHLRKNKLPHGEMPFNGLLGRYKKEARLRKYDFLLSKEEFKQLISSNCEYCGDAPINKFANNRIPTDFILYNGIDRVDNSKGYFLQNCVSCCYFCNMAKHHFSKEFFLDKIKKIYNKHHGITT